jgi:16S rRNA (uracil1498-N3)-methyltransferase
MRRFLVDGISRGDRSVLIAGEEFYHLSKVLRLKPGDQLTVFDGKGVELSGRIESVKKDRALIEITGIKKTPSESRLEITLIQGVAKGRKMDIIVQKAVELGVSVIQPFYAKRTIPRLDRRGEEKRLIRWKRVAVEAVKQCGRAMVPDIARPLKYDEAIEDHGDCLKLIPWEMERAAGLKDILEENASEGIEKVAVLIGPEGGFSEEDVREACDKGFLPVSLGPRILRTETAAIAVLGILQYELGDMG